MSYNTRRGAGRGSPSTQVNYHQQPTRPASNMAQASRNAGYSTTSKPPVTYNNPVQSSYSTPAYSTTPPQPKPAQQPQPQPQAAQPTTTAAVKPPTTPAVKPPTTPAVTTPTTPAVKPDTTLSATLALALKQEPVTPADTPKMDTTENGESDGAKVPFWKRRPLVKVTNKVRRARQNAKLRRVLNPKNALTFLNELRPGSGKFVVKEDPGWGYVATVEIDGKTFTGHGLGTSKAKVQASEKALKFLLLEQLSKAQQAAAESKEESNNDDDKMEAEEEGDESKGKHPKPKPEDEVPWGSLAAFALHKLFSDWQKEGPLDAPVVQMPYPVEKYDEDIGEEQYFTRRPVPPEFGAYRGRGFPPYGPRGRGYAPYPSPRVPGPPGYGPAPVRRPHQPFIPPVASSTSFAAPMRPQAIPGEAAVNLKPMRKIPEDANQRHPVMLLNQLKPNLVYNETREGEQPRVTFIISIEVDGQQYVGKGKNKKEAKKQAAKAALAPMGIIYREED